MLNNCNYDKIKLLYKVSKLASFIERHAIKDAKANGHQNCVDIYNELKDDLERHLESLRRATETVSKEGQLKNDDNQ